MSQSSDSMRLIGLDASNPLAFLAALGVVRVLSEHAPERNIKLGWCRHRAAWCPFLVGDPGFTRQEIIEELDAAFRMGSGTVPDSEVGRIQAMRRSITEKEGAIERQLRELKEKGLRKKERQAAVADLRESLDSVIATYRKRVAGYLYAHKKLPFPGECFLEELRSVREAATPGRRRSADFLAACGSDAYLQDSEEDFDDSWLRFLRSSDSAGQGMLHYGAHIYFNSSPTEFRRALFENWRYEEVKYSLRWDPKEDRRYAYRWGDPSSESVRAIPGANALALVGFTLYPTVPEASRARTVGFYKQGRKVYFNWPVWEAPVGLDIIRTLLTLPGIASSDADCSEFRQRGVVAIFQAERVMPNVYYKNFSPAVSRFGGG